MVSVKDARQNCVYTQKISKNEVKKNYNVIGDVEWKLEEINICKK